MAVWQTNQTEAPIKISKESLMSEAEKKRNLDSLPPVSPLAGLSAIAVPNGKSPVKRLLKLATPSYTVQHTYNA